MSTAFATPAAAGPASQACPVSTAVAFMAAAGAGLGCATSAPFTTDVAEQTFEHGSMLWVAEWGSISVLSDDPDGHYEAYDDLFNPDAVEPAPLGSADPKLIEPRQGFGKIWRQLGGPTSALGWATAPEVPAPATVQYFEQGAAMQRSGGTAYLFVMVNHTHGRWVHAGGARMRSAAR